MRTTATRLSWLAAAAVVGAGCGHAGYDDGRNDGGGNDDGAKDAGQPDGAAAPLSWVQVAPGGRYFATEKGAPFVVMGNQPGSFLDFSDEDMEAHFARMREYGETVMRVDFDCAHAGVNEQYHGLESTLGVINETRAARVDRAFALAQQYGIHILVVPWATSVPLWDTWHLNPYSLDMGGVAADPHDFLMSEQARAAFAHRLKLIASRWGASATVFAWDLMNESNVLFGWPANYLPPDKSYENDPASIGSFESWVARFGAVMAAGDAAAAGGRTHPRMVSWILMLPPSANGAHPYDFLFRSGSLDSASTHPYDFYGTQVNKGPPKTTSAIQPALTVHARLTEILGSRLTDRRPYLENERATNQQTMLRFHRESDHNMAWAELASGAAGTGITWLSENSGQNDLRARHANLGSDRRALRTFIDQRVPSEFFLSKTGDESLDALSSTDAAVKVMSVRRDRWAIGWLLGKSPACEKCVLTDCVNEVRENRKGGNPVPASQGVLAIIMWSGLLKDEGVTVSDPRLDALMSALKNNDQGAVESKWPAAFDCLTEVEEGTGPGSGLLVALAKCPDLSPPVAISMPGGRDYSVDWIDDRTANVLRTDDIPGGHGVVVPPVFERHLALVVRPN